MTEIKNERLNESYYFVKHKSGLPIYIYPKEGYSSTYAIFGTKYGSINTIFKADGKTVKVPDGIAHYLEHKLFESEGEDAFLRYAKTGASANAFTSFDKTCYLFNCTENFKESFEILLDFVQNPYFTKETVQKEQGIIGQEIKMYDDDPNWKVMFNLLVAMYHNHPVKIDIAGTVESIAEITAEKLYDCYNAYYNLHNMVLCVVGGVNIEEVLSLADKMLKPCNDVLVENVFPDEPETIVKNRIEEKFPMSLSMFQLGFKEKAGDKRVSQKEMADTDILLQAFASRSSALYTELMDLNLINDTFGYEYFEGPGYASVIFSGESRDPDKTADIIKKHIRGSKDKGIEKHEFEQAKNTVYGRAVASLNSVEAIGVGLVNGHFVEQPLFEYINHIADSTPEDVNSRLKHQLIVENCALSVVSPIGSVEN